MELNQFVMLLEIIGPAGILGMIYFIKRLTDRMDATNASIGSTNQKLDKFVDKLDNMGLMIAQEHRNNAELHSREHKDMSRAHTADHKAIELEAVRAEGKLDLVLAKLDKVA